MPSKERSTDHHHRCLRLILAERFGHFAEQTTDSVARKQVTRRHIRFVVLPISVVVRAKLWMLESSILGE